MADAAQRLVLLSPHGIDANQVDALVPALGAACAGADVAAFVLRLRPADERGLVNLVKAVVPAVQAHGTAIVLACPGFAGDLVAVAARGGADGIHIDKAAEGSLRDLRGRLREGRILGMGGVLDSRHQAMAAGEAGVDYLMFGGLYPDGIAPDPQSVRQQAAWWAEIFETPCIAVAAEPDEIADLAATGAEFVGLESKVWLHGGEGVTAAQAALQASGEAR